MDIRKNLFTYPHVYNHEDTNALFFDAFKDTVRFHQHSCPEYRALLEHEGFTFDTLTSYDALSTIPALPTLFLKSHTLLSIPEHKLRMRSTTSGTKGTPSIVGLDTKSMYYGFIMLRKTCSYWKLFSARPTNYIILGYQPSKRNEMGAVKTAFGATLLAPAKRKEYALKDIGDSYVVNIEGVYNTLLSYSRQNAPVRLLGFPSYMYFLLRALQKDGVKLVLPKHSKVLLGGGWKQFFAEQMDKTALYEMIKEMLGIPEESCKEFFGVVEHPVPYFDCPHHHFHVPAYSRVIIRDTKTLQPVGFGKPGLLNLLTPLLRSMPLHSVITDDIAVLREGGECGCGIKTPYFDVFGRSGVQGIKTCAAGAKELLQESTS